MNVEPKPAMAAHGRSLGAVHAKDKANGQHAGAGGTPEEGGFLSLLASLSADEGDGDLLRPDASAVPTTSPQLPPPDAGGAPTAAPSALLSDAGAVPMATSPALLSGPGIAPAAPSQPHLPMPPDGGVTSTSQIAGTTPQTLEALPSWTEPEPMPPGRPLADVLPATEGPPVVAAGAPAAGRDLAQQAAKPAEQGLKLGQDEALRNLAGPLGRAVSERMQVAAPGRLVSRSASEAALAHGGDDVRSRAAGAEAGWRVDMASAASVATEQALNIATALPATTERRSEKAGDPAARLLGEPLGSLPAQVQGNTAEVAAASAEAALGGPGLQVAEQVSYWIANDVQNAELKLDQFGNSPVEVSISLQGNEARVEFRTDLQEMRQVLQGAVTQLKDMLHSQGLVLAGVSVGTSGADSSGPRQQPPARQSLRQATVAVPQLAQLGGARAAQLSGRALDVFV